MMREAELLSKLPSHPQVISFYGALVRDGRIEGLALEKADMNLREAGDLAYELNDVVITQQKATGKTWDVVLSGFSRITKIGDEKLFSTGGDPYSRHTPAVTKPERNWFMLTSFRKDLVTGQMKFWSKEMKPTPPLVDQVPA